MKTLKVLALAAALIILGGCEKPQSEQPVEEPAYVNLDSGQSSSVKVGYDGTDFSLSFKTNKNWNIDISYGSGSSGWVALSSTGGAAGSQALVVTVKANEGKTSRTAVISIKAGDASAGITLSQDPFVREFSISPSSIEIGEQGGTVEVKVISNIGCQASTNVEWIRPVDLKASQTRSLWFLVDANPSVEARSGLIVICDDEGECIPVTVSQQAGKASISISSVSLEFEPEGGMQTLTVTSNTRWTVSEKPDWCILSPGGADGDASVTVSVTENLKASARDGKISFYINGDASADVYIKQQPAAPTLDVGGTGLFVPGTGGQVNLKIASNTDWTVSTDASWLKTSSGRGSGDSSVILTADSNPEVVSRMTEVTVRTVDGSISRTIEVTQDEGEPSLELSTYSLQFDSTASCNDVIVSGNVSWTVSCAANWCVVEKNQQGNAVRICVSANESGKKRSAEVSVKAGKGGIVKTLTVLQTTSEDNEGFGDDGEIIWD